MEKQHYSSVQFSGEERFSFWKWVQTTDLFAKLSVAYSSGALGAVANGLMAVLIYVTHLGTLLQASKVKQKPFTPDAPAWVNERFDAVA